MFFLLQSRNAPHTFYYALYLLLYGRASRVCIPNPGASSATSDGIVSGQRSVANLKVALGSGKYVQTGFNFMIEYIVRGFCHQMGQ